jgi:hypothetical protein
MSPELCQRFGHAQHALHRLAVAGPEQRTDVRGESLEGVPHWQERHFRTGQKEVGVFTSGQETDIDYLRHH